MMFMQWFRLSMRCISWRRCHYTTCLTLFFLQIKQANSGAQLGARPAHGQQSVLTAGGPLNSSSPFLLHEDEAGELAGFRFYEMKEDAPNETRTKSTQRCPPDKRGFTHWQESDMKDPANTQTRLKILGPRKTDGLLFSPPE